MAQMPKKIRIATDGASPPWSQLKPDGTLEGFEIDFYPILCQRMGVQCEIVAQSFEGLIPALGVGKFDAIMASMSATAKRAEVIAFSVPYGATGNTFATVKGSPLEQLPGHGTVLSLAGDDASVARALEAFRPLLQGRTIGVQTASVSAAFADRYLRNFVTIREYKTTQEHDLDLLAGRLDAVIAGRTYLGAAMKQPGYDRLVLVGPESARRRAWSRRRHRPAQERSGAEGSFRPGDPVRGVGRHDRAALAEMVRLRHHAEIARVATFPDRAATRAIPPLPCRDPGERQLCATPIVPPSLNSTKFAAV